MNLYGTDLNLLTVFDALMAERHVTRAGERLGLSQPATSNALARLRQLTRDELFVRSGGRLQPTPTAIALAQQIQPALQQIAAALQREQPFEPATSDRVFTIGMTDYVEFALLPKLLERLQQVASEVKLQIRAGERSQLLALLDSGEADLICGLFPEQIAWHEGQRLFREEFVCVCRQDHPSIGDTLSLEDYLSVSHLLVSIKGDRTGPIDTLLVGHLLCI
ncbi:MAG: LysR family transcriptional regulator [Leptolyngbya sp. SIO4C1]|nr:LysR family transcriptional regulator [Leptolyngbya sp. SIO4C1]